MHSLEIGLRQLLAASQLAHGMAAAELRPPIIEANRFLPGVHVFWDLNADGKFAPGSEPSLANVGVQLINREDGSIRVSGYTDGSGQALFAIPWDGSELDGSMYALGFSQQAGAPACRLTGQRNAHGELVTSFESITDEDGDEIGRVWEVGMDCDGGEFPAPPSPLLHTVKVCADAAGDGRCDPQDAPIADTEVRAYTSSAVAVAPIPVEPLGTGITNAQGETSIPTQTGDVVWSVGDDACDLTVQTVTPVDNVREVTIAADCTP